MRQRPSRYAIHAGRNLPDKELRYLRTVIVTAAIHRGFGSGLLPEGMTHSLNLPALGRRQSLYVVSATLQRPVFLVNSRLGHFTAASRSFGGEPLNPRRYSFFRSYGVILPSYLTRVLPSTLGSSPRLPVLVLVRSPMEFPTRLFLCAGQAASPKRGLVITSGTWRSGFAWSDPSGLNGHF